MQRLTQRYRYSIILLRELVRTDFKLRYQGSVLGYAWSLLRPFLLFVTLYIVFAKFLKVGNAVPHFPVYLLLGIVMWNYFTEVTSGSIGAIVGKGDLLRKINFPKYVIILAGSSSALINLGLNAIIIAIFVIVGHVPVGLRALWLAPLVVELFLAGIALAFFLSAAYVKFRDVNYIWEVILQAAFYGTPILYPLTRIPVSYHLRELFLLNPMAQIIQDARYALVTPQSLTIHQVYGGDNLIWLIPIGLTLAVTAFAALYFRHRSRTFAEEA